MKILIIEDDFIFGERLKKLIDEKLAGKKNEIVIQKNITNLDLSQNEVYKTLKSFLSELNADKFFRINNYTIINLEYVKSVNNKRITLTNDTQFTLKRNYNSFVDAYHNNYMKRFKQ